MNNLDIIPERMDSLRRLSTKETIYLDDIGVEFQQDLQNFIVGETLTIRNGKVAIGNNRYRQWLDKIRKKGFDYEIDFK